MIGICEDCGKNGKVIQTKNKIFCVRCYNRKWAQSAFKNPQKLAKIYSSRR